MPIDNLDGKRVKKTLSERVHHDNTGVVMHRDLFSAYLGLYINQEGYLSVEDGCPSRVFFLRSRSLVQHGRSSNKVQAARREYCSGLS